MIDLYNLTVYEHDGEILTKIGNKTAIFKTLSIIMSDMNKDITFKIKLAQQ